jgi:asparagine synthase (glutamine-hydrolysing)
MCGIAGLLTDPESTPAHSLIEGMCNQLIHRGPDAAGYFVEPGIALGHRRLSIIDTTGGNQPIANEDGTLQVIFNGEIYNFQELRTQLIAKGHQFRTHSDTEVLVHLYEDYGEDMPQHLNGMFAFAIWDVRRRELFLARDRFGEKPLYYTSANRDGKSGSTFAFASELKALLGLPGFDRRIRPQSVADFLTFSYVPDPHCIYSGVSKLEAGHSLTVSARGHRITRYWQPKFRESYSGEKQTASEMFELAADCVERRMVSDVPLGAFLSGGVDSSAVVGFMARSLRAHAGSHSTPDRVKTFSIGFTDKAFDELEYARIIAKLNETEHREQVVTPDVGEILDPLTRHFDEPFGDSSAIPMMYLARMTRQYVTVALSGDGADELFGGYRRYVHGVLEANLRNKFPQVFRETVIRGAARVYPKFDYLPQMFRAKTMLTNLAQDLADSYFTSMSTFREADLAGILDPAFARSLGGYSPRQWMRQKFAAYSHLDPLQQMQAVDLETWLPGDILVKTDRATMAYSLEGRAPWLDHRLHENFFRAPTAWKVHSMAGKRLFKDAVSPLVPDQLLHRPKMGFSVPLAKWFRTSLKTRFEAMVLGGSLEGMIHTDGARALWQEHQSGLRNHDRKLWNLLMLAEWNKRYAAA